MTQLEQKLAEAISALIPGFDLPGIIEAARGQCACDQTVGTSLVTKMETPAPTEQPAAKRTRETAEAPAAPVAEPQKPDPSPEAAKPPANATEMPGINLSVLFEGSGASKKLNKFVFLAAVEKATTLAALIALNTTCDCGFATGDYTEETAPVLKRKLTRWGNAQ